jgi:signal peptidase I
MPEPTVGGPPRHSQKLNRQKTNPRKPGWQRNLIEWGTILVVAVVVAFLLRSFVVQPYYIPSGSMVPTLEVGDKVLVDKLSYHMHGVHRGDVIVFKKPADDYTPHVSDLIKRVIGLSGETLSSGPAGEIFVDGKPIKQSWLTAGAEEAPGPSITNLGCANHGPTVDSCVVPKGDFFVMGDDRGNSDDSRYFGPISGKLIVGRAFLVVWPLSHLKTL